MTKPADFSKPAAAGLAGTLERITDDVYALVGFQGFTNCGLILTGEGAVVVDTRLTPVLARAFLEEIKKVTDEPVRYVINTHFHGDHTFGNQVFSPFATIVAHRTVAPYLLSRGESHIRWFASQFPPMVEGLKEVVLTPPHMAFDHSLTLTIGRKHIDLRHLGNAHTGSDIVVHVREDRVVFTGDILNTKIPALGDAMTVAQVGDAPSLAHWIWVLEDLERWDADVFIPGHGGVGEKADIPICRQYFENVRDKVLDCVKKGMTAEEALEAIDASEYEGWRLYEQWWPTNVRKWHAELTLGTTLYDRG